MTVVVTETPHQQHVCPMLDMLAAILSLLSPEMFLLKNRINRGVRSCATIGSALVHVITVKPAATKMGMVRLVQSTGNGSERQPLFHETLTDYLAFPPVVKCRNSLPWSAALEAIQILPGRNTLARIFMCRVSPTSSSSSSSSSSNTNNNISIRCLPSFATMCRQTRMIAWRLFLPNL